MLQKAARREPFTQAADQGVGEAPLGGPDGIGVPFGGFEVVDRDEGRLAAHGQAQIMLHQIAVDRLPQGIKRRPALFLERHGDADRLDQPGHRHVKAEVDFRRAGHAGDRGGGGVMRRGRQGDVALPGQQAGSGVEPDPAGARNVDFRPGMQVAEVRARPRGPVEGVDVGLELDQVAGHEAGGEAQLSGDLHQ